ncbi:MAG: hypothetical protein JOZ19_06450 [Rubrobacter sp.]|nr:hypothetical protein [Rubrobacter sp.]
MSASTDAFSAPQDTSKIRSDVLLSKKNLAIKLLLNPRARRVATRLLKDPHVRRVIVKLIARQLRRR